MHRRTPLLFALALALAAPAAAQDAGRFEFGMFGGGSIGSRISLTPGSDIRIGDAGAFGLRGAYDFSRHFALEASWSRTRPTATTRNPSTGNVFAETPVDIDTVMVSALYNYGRGRVRGYFGLGAGVMIFDPVLAPSTGSSARFTTSLSAGAKFFVTPSIAFRLDGTYRFRTTDSRVSTVVCLDGCKTYTTSFYSNAELTAGVSVRLGGEPFADTVSPADRESASQKRFWAAAGSVAFFDVVPWAFNRYVTKADFAYISMDTFRANVTAGFGYDRDSFKTDQSSHPFHGSLFFNSARSNGYGFWESGIFAAAGSFAWELALEKEPPAINDLVNTTLGGMSRGEAFHRLATMLRDNTVSGSSRFWRELGAGVMDPAGFLTRLTRGELKGTTTPNPEGRMPEAFRLDGDVGYRHIGGDASNPDQALFRFTLQYGDPFLKPTEKPFDSFVMGMDVSVPATPLVTRFNLGGILTGRELTDASSTGRHLLGVFMEYEYIDNQAQVFGAEAFSAGLLSRYALKSGMTLSTSATGVVFPIAGVGTTDFLNPVSGRSFDYGPGGGLRATARLSRKGRELLSAGYGIAWTHTLDGSSKSNQLQFFRADGRWPLGKKLGVGAGYSWYSRKTTYTGFFEGTKSQSEWRAFVSWNLL